MGQYARLEADEGNLYRARAVLEHTILGEQSTRRFGNWLRLAGDTAPQPETNATLVKHAGEPGGRPATSPAKRNHPRMALMIHARSSFAS